MFGPGLRRDLTEDFRELRDLCNERHRQRAGPRLGWLLRIIGHGDAQELAHFVEVIRTTKKGQPARACAWCNSRIALRPDPAEMSDGVRQAKECQICMAWHCNPCCAYFVNFGVGEPAAKAIWRGRSSGLECCHPCKRLFDVLLWQQEAPPRGLAECSRQLLAAHGELDAGLTTLASTLAQLEGLAQLPDLTAPAGLPEGDSEPLDEVREECRQALTTTRAKAMAANTAVETTLRNVDKIVCAGRGRDDRIKEALVRRGRLGLDELKCRLRAVELRLNDAAVRGRRSRLQVRRRSWQEGDVAGAEAYPLEPTALSPVGAAAAVLASRPPLARRMDTL